MKEPQVVTIGISGPSCGGKTTLALLLKKLLKNVIVINQDEYFKKDDEIPIDEQTGLANWDSPAAVNFEGLNEAISYARKNPYKLLSEKEKPLQNNHHGSDLLSYQDFNHIFNELDGLKDVIFIIIEGFLLFCDAKVCDNIDNKYFVTASRNVLKERRESREGYVTLQGYWVDPPNYFDQVVWPQFVQWNEHILDDSKRDPLITVLNTDNYSSLDITTMVVKQLNHKYK